MSYPDSNNLTTLARLKASFDPPIETNSVTSFIVSAGGANYTTATATITGGGGSGATATVILSGGAVVAVRVNSRGKDYHAAPTVLIVGDGTGVAVTAVLSNDDALQDLITEVSNFICNELPDLVIAAETAITETRNGQGGNAMILRKRPATAITSLTINGTTVPQSSNRSAGWILDPDGNAVHLIGYQFTRDVQNVTVVYEAGLEAGDRRLGMLERLCCIVAVSWFKRRARVDQSSVSANGSVSQSFSLAAMPSEAQAILDSLRSQAVIFE